jgi:hypothetical protein
MIKTSYINFGAQTKLTIQGDNATELAQYVNRLSNFGMFPEESLPFDYKPELDTRVIVAATTVRVHGILRAMAESELETSPDFAAWRAQFKGRAGGFLCDLPDKAAEMAAGVFATWERRNDEVVTAANGAKATDLPLLPYENTAEFRAVKDRLLGAFRDNRHVRASGAR